MRLHRCKVDGAESELQKRRGRGVWGFGAVLHTATEPDSKAKGDLRDGPSAARIHSLARKPAETPPILHLPLASQWPAARACGHTLARFMRLPQRTPPPSIPACWKMTSERH